MYYWIDCRLVNIDVMSDDITKSKHGAVVKLEGT
jgi:hypothetical protein